MDQIGTVGSQALNASGSAPNVTTAPPSTKPQDFGHTSRDSWLAQQRHERASQYMSFFQCLMGLASILVALLIYWLSMQPSIGLDNSKMPAATGTAAVLPAVRSEPSEMAVVPPAKPVPAPSSRSAGAPTAAAPVDARTVSVAPVVSPAWALNPVQPTPVAVAPGGSAGLASRVMSYFNGQLADRHEIAEQFGDVHLRIDSISASMIGTGVAQCSFIASVTGAKGVEIVVKRQFEQVVSEARPISDFDLEMQACREAVHDVIRRLR